MHGGKALEAPKENAYALKQGRYLAAADTERKRILDLLCTSLELAEAA